MAHPTSAVSWLHPEQNTKHVYQHPTAAVRQTSWIQAQNGFSCTAAIPISVNSNVLGVMSAVRLLDSSRMSMVTKGEQTSKEGFKVEKHSSKISLSGADIWSWHRKHPEEKNWQSTLGLNLGFEAHWCSALSTKDVRRFFHENSEQVSLFNAMQWSWGSL